MTVAIKTDVMPPETTRLEVARVLGWRLWEEKRGEYLLQVATAPTDREPWMRSRDWKAQSERYRALTWDDYNRGSMVGEFPRWTERIADAWSLLWASSEDDLWRMQWERDRIHVYLGPATGIAKTEETGGDKDKAVCLAICRAFLRYMAKEW
jgi:hypothetical protein